jgi:hypothetical protein
MYAATGKNSAQATRNKSLNILRMAENGHQILKSWSYMLKMCNELSSLDPREAKLKLIDEMMTILIKRSSKVNILPCELTK